MYYFHVQLCAPYLHAQFSPLLGNESLSRLFSIYCTVEHRLSRNMNFVDDIDAIFEGFDDHFSVLLVVIHNMKCQMGIYMLEANLDVTVKKKFSTFIGVVKSGS